MKKTLLSFACLLSVLLTFSQTEIKGTVLDNSGLPVAGANIIIKESTFGSNSDFDGNFSFSVNLTGDQIIQVSYLGYETFEQSINLDNGGPIIAVSYTHLTLPTTPYV